MIPKFRGLIRNKEIIPNNPQQLRYYLSSFEGKEIVLTVKEFKKTRSLEQNAYYWCVVVDLIGKHQGYMPNEYEERVHMVLRSMFLGKYVEIKTKEGVEKIRVAKSTTKLNTKEFEEYLSNIRQWASEYLNLYIPLPDEVEFE